MIDTNSITLIGEAASAPEYSHAVYGEAFYRMTFAVRRLSSAVDALPVTVSERLLGQLPVEEGMRFFINGQIRSYNKRTETGSRLVITVFAKEFRPALDEESGDLNEAELTGFICKPVIYRTTPFSREIADLLIAVNRRTGRSDYLPCIAWGRNARYLSELPVGTALSVLGRLQSREYKKVTPEGEEIIRTAYELSCSAVAELE